MVTRQTLIIKQKDELTNRFVEKEVSIRSYEVSIWTLQDSFITVLKWSNLENKGQIQQPKIILDVDGTQEFSFSIPMYLEPGKENPIWYNTTNGNLMISMRKIKVILNKGLKDGSEKVYEFIITKVNERHEQDTLFCDVSCEGLAFHELGKRGYKLSLSAENFYAIYEEWFKNGANPATEPHQTLDYWMQDVCGIEKIPENPVPNKWYYRVQMNWNSIGEASFRQPDRIYEDSYVSSWEVSDNKLVPAGTENAREKERPVEIEESNIYNITQTIAETFQVFCRYDYGYDENYHIISRTITFYNNFIAEQDGYMDLTYPYETSAITREMDGTDLCTKLFVRPADYEYSPSGLVTIMDVDANRSKEDYILNFDYLHKFNIITDEQYASIEPYEAKMRLLNTEIEEAQNKISHFDDILLDVNAKIKTNTDIIANAEKQATTAQEHINGLTNGEDGIITIDANNAKPQIILTDDDGNKYIKIPVTGVISSTIRLYYKKNYGAGDVFSNDFEMTGGTCVPDEYGDVARVVFGPNDITYEDNGSTITASSLWLTCQYSPRTYWEAVKKYWIRIGNAAKDDNESWLVHKKTLFENARNAQQTILDNKLEEKAAAITDFEYMMGPALREGYWQPEEYQDYGDKHLINNSFPSYNDSIEEGLAIIFWDEHYFDTYDTKIKYQDSLDPAVGDKEYLIVKLSNDDLAYIRAHYDELSFIYYDAAVAAMQEALNNDNNPLHQQTVRNGLKSCHINSGCRLSWIKENNEIYPALIVEDNKVLQDDQLKFIVKNELHSYLGVVEYDNTTYLPRKDDNAIELTTYNYTISESTLILNNGTRAEVFPRIKIDSLSLKNSSNELKITLGDRVLAEYQDYTVLILEDPTAVAGNDVVFKYYITLKPHVFYKASNQTFKMSYSISNAQTYIYLDALQVSKENSQPKVSYTVDLSIYNPIIIHDIYNKLSQIVHINDNALKFENVQGYISRIEMDLDLPQEDTIEVKNYKTKFEDLFSTIVAQTEAMKKNSYGYDIASAAFNNDGTLNTDVLIESINNPNFNITEAFINAGFDGIDIVKNTLKNLFDEAGQILSGAGQGLNDLKSLATSNADILSGLFAGIQDGFANGLDYSVPIELITGDTKNISAIRINKDEGIFMGSNRKITLSSTNAIKTDDGYIADSDIALSGANVELSPERLLLGVTNLNNSQGGVVDITSDQVLLAVGNAVSVLEDSDTNITASTQSGVQIKKDYIGLATGNGTNRSIISLSPNEIHIGATTLNQESGNYIHISKDEFKLGGTADLYINTNNFKLQTNAGATDNQSHSSIGNTVFAIGSNLNGIGATSTAADAETNGTVNFLVNQNGAYIKGTVYANAGSFTGAITATSLTIVNGNNSSTFQEYLAALNARIDGEIQTWFEKGTPYPNTYLEQSIKDQITNSDLTYTIIGSNPSVNSGSPHWSEADNEKHIGDIYYDIAGKDESINNKKSKTAGSAFRFIKNGSNYYWQQIPDTITTETAAAVQNAQTNIENIADGTTGLAFTNSGSNSFVTLNKTDGLVIMGNKVGSYYPFFKATNNAMGFFHAASPTTTLTNADNGLLYYETGNLYVKGHIYASSFHLTVGNQTYNTFEDAVSNTSVVQGLVQTDIEIKYYANIEWHSDVWLRNTTNVPTNSWQSTMASAVSALGSPAPTSYYLYIRTTITYSNNLSKTSFSVSHVGSDGETANITFSYTTSTSGTTIPSSGWQTTYEAAAENWNSTNQFLWTRTTTVINGTTSNSYTISRWGKDGEKGDKGDKGNKGDDGKYVTEITVLYLLTNSNNVATPTAQTVSTWSSSVPQWDSNTHNNSYHYYKCEQYKWSDNTYTWSAPAVDYGTTYAVTTATSASNAASEAQNATQPISAYGIIGRDITYANTTQDNITYDANGYPIWNNNPYGLILGNSTTHPMLIGSNSGITIAKPSGAAVVLNSSGIAMNGSNLIFNAGNGNTLFSLIGDPSQTNGITEAGIYLGSGQSQMSLTSSGTVNLSGASSVTIGSGNASLILSNGALTIKANSFQTLDANGQLQNMWGRDDIIVMNPSATGNDAWRGSVATIEAKMSGKGDWVLIRPYYNSLISYYYSPTADFSVNNSATFSVKTTNNDPYFGSGATYFKYKISFECSSWSNSGISNSQGLKIYLRATPDNNALAPLSIDIGANSTSGSVSNGHIWTGPNLGPVGDRRTITVETGNLNGSNFNLCQEGYTISVEMINITGDAALAVRNFLLDCTTDTTQSRVPCTVYYYPAQSS